MNQRLEILWRPLDELIMNMTEEALQQSAELFTNGSVTFPIIEYSVQISKMDGPLYRGACRFQSVGQRTYYWIMPTL